jgi:hypothetical protein
MISVSPFERGHAGEVVALWRALHPDWKWLDDPATCNELFESSDAVERAGFLARRGQALIASIFATSWRDQSLALTRRIRIEARREDIAAEWLEDALARFLDRDRGQVGTWHMAVLDKASSPVVAPPLQAAGFAPYSRQLLLEWVGDSVTLADPGPARLERYAGGNAEIDRAIVEVHNRSYLPARLVPPMALADLWKPWLGLQVREFVLAWEQDRLVGYADWSVGDDEVWISDYASMRLGIGAAVGTKAMQLVLELGHRRIKSMVHTANEASVLLLLRKFGCKVTGELTRSFVRKL